MNTNSSYDKENHPPGEWLEYEGGNRQKRRSSILVNPSLISVTGGSEKKVGRSALVDRPSSFMKKTNLNNRDVEEQNGSQMDDEETEREPNDDRKENILELKHGVKGSGIKAKIASTTKYLSNGSSASKNNHGNRRVSFAATAHVRIFDKHENEWTESPEKDDCENKSEEWKNTNQGMETINTRFTQFKTEEDGEEEEEEDIYKKDQVQAQNIPSDDHDVIESLQIPDIISNDQKHGTVLSQSLEMINVPKEDESIIENDENDTMEMTSCLGSIFRQDEFDDMDTTDMSLQSLPDNVVQQVLSRKDSFLLLPEKLSSVWHEEEFTMNQKSNEQLLDQVDTMQMTTSFGYVIQQNDSSSDSDFNSDNDLQKELFVSCGNDMTVTMQLTGEVNNILCKKSEDNQQADVCQESTMDLKVMDQPLLNFSYHDKREEQTMELTQCNPELHEQNFIKNSASECTETVIFRSDAQFKSRVDEQTNYVITGVQHKSENIALSGTHIDSPILAVSLHSSVVAPSVDQGMNLSASLKMTNNIAEKAPDTIPVLMKTTFSASEHIEAMIELNDIEKFKDKKIATKPALVKRPFQSIKLQEFLCMANIRFLDNLSGNGRRETLGHLRQTAPLSSFLDIVRASCVALPEAEIYRFGCSELAEYIAGTKESIENNEELIEKNSPKIFYQLTHGDDVKRAKIQNRLKSIKNIARLVARKKWYEWREKLVISANSGLSEYLIQLERDKKILKKVNEKFSVVMENIKHHYSHVANELSVTQATLKKRRKHSTILDQEQILSLKQGIEEQRGQIQLFTQDVEDLKNFERSLLQKLENLQQSKSDIQKNIEDSKIYCRQANFITPAELKKQKQYYIVSQSFIPWRLLKLSNEMAEFSFGDDILLHVGLLQNNSKGSKISRCSVHIAPDPQNRFESQIFQFLKGFEPQVQRFTYSKDIPKILCLLSSFLTRLQMLIRDLKSIQTQYSLQVTYPSPQILTISASLVHHQTPLKIQVNFQISAATFLYPYGPMLYSLTPIYGHFDVSSLESAIRQLRPSHQRFSNLLNSLNSLFQQSRKMIMTSSSSS